MSATPAAQDLNTLAPKDFDEALAALHKRYNQAANTLNSALTSVHYAARDRRIGYGKDARWTLSDAEATAQARTFLDDQENPRYRHEAKDALERLEKAQSAVDALEKAIDEYDEVFQARGGWARFFLVNNTNGHIHSSRGCSSCTFTTDFSWLPSVSDKSESEAVAEFGPMLCTRCFPSAPIEWTNHWEKEEERKKALSCPGSGTTDWVAGSTRFGFVSGNGGTCSHCNEWAAATSSRNIRKHKAPGK